MTTQPDYLRFLESAKQAEIASQLLQDDFVIEQDKFVDGSVFDLVATKHGRSTAYLFKSAGHRRFSKEEFLQFNQVAVAHGYQLRVVVAVPPPRVEVEVEDLSDHLLQHLIDQTPSELDSLSTHTQIDGVHDLAVESIYVGRGHIRVSGTANVDLLLQYGSGSDEVPPSSDAIPFRFTALLDATGSLVEVENIEFDLTDFEAEEI